ncbi:MAG: carbon monoxide dehydrogenase [Anaerolineae bacterium]|nr:MAG: carbon monoxide dehydrogenase [Anaerolineae bacterium]
MLLNLKTIHKPATLAEALTLLRQGGTFPLYGGAALQRNPRPDVEAVVDLSQIGLERAWEEGDALHLGSMLTLERVRLICQERGQTYPLLGGVAEALRADLPETLRNTFTLGDLLVERDAQSVTLTLLLALDAAIVTADESVWPLADWLASGDDAWRVLVTHVSVPRGATRAAVAFEKVSRTPADAPIVGAVAAVQITAEGRRTALALCGVAPWPLAQPEAACAFDQSGEVNAALDRLTLDPPSDHWGSREYRTEMARVLTRRALLAAVEKVK